MAMAPGFSSTDVYSNPPPEVKRDVMTLLEAMKLKAQTLTRLYQNNSSRLRDLQMALETYVAAAEIVDQVRIGARLDQARLILANHASVVLHEAIEAAYQLYLHTGNEQYAALIFSFSQRSKAAALSLALMESNARRFAGVPDQILERERVLRADLAHWETKLEKASKSHSDSDPAVTPYEEKVFNLRSELRVLLQDIETRFPTYHKLIYNRNMPTVEQVQEKLNEDTAVLDYVLTDRMLLVSCLTRDHFDLAAVELDSTFVSTLSALVGSFRSVANQAAYRASAVELYRLLLRPLDHHPGWQATYLAIRGFACGARRW